MDHQENTDDLLNNPQVKLADLLWERLWEEPEPPQSGVMKWLLIGGAVVVAIILFFVFKK